ncbi:MAG: tetratricopeptide repeat protein [Deltaproteobacteria bacterium]|nr:tetratricopeptide repeat protein [Deltaproteobacteria bacterium]
MARTEQRLTRKDLRQPDEFQTLSRQALEFVEANRTAVTAALAALIVLLLAIVSYRMISQSREASASVAYTEARALLTDKKYGDAAVKFEDVASRYGGTSYGPLAILERGNALLLADQAADAVAAYEKFLRSAPPTDYLRQLAHTRLGYAQEKLGKPADAERAFATAASEPGPFGAESLFGAARNAEAAGSADKAKDLYTQLLEKHPASEYRDVASAHLTALGGTVPAAKAAPDGAAVVRTE